MANRRFSLTPLLLFPTFSIIFAFMITMNVYQIGKLIQQVDFLNNEITILKNSQ